MTKRPCDPVTQQKSEPIYRPFLQSVGAIHLHIKFTKVETLKVI